MQDQSYEIFKKITEYMQSYSLNKIIQRNFAKSIGRLALANPQRISGDLDKFGQQFCKILINTSNDEHKKQAFQGFFKLILLNPSGIVNNMHFFLQCFMNYHDAEPELKKQFVEIVLEYQKIYTPEEWELYLTSNYFTPGFRNHIK